MVGELWEVIPGLLDPPSLHLISHLQKGQRPAPLPVSASHPPHSITPPLCSESGPQCAHGRKGLLHRQALTPTPTPALCFVHEQQFPGA